MVYYVTGGGGAPLYPVFGDWFTAYSDSLNHFLKVEVNDCWLRLDALDANGYVFDSYEFDHPGSLIYFPIILTGSMPLANVQVARPRPAPPTGSPTTRRSGSESRR